MNILAIDTSSKNASVSILDDEKILIELNNNDEKTHSQKLMPMIDKALKKLNITLDDIKLISCCLGPGSFTGVRIGIATAKAFCDTKNIASVGISSLEALAYKVNKPGIICSLIDAGHGNVYAGLFEIIKQNDSLKILNKNLSFLNLQDEITKKFSNSLNIFLESSNNINIKNKTICFVGNATEIYSDFLKNLNLVNNNIIKIVADFVTASASTLGILGYLNYINGEYGNSSILSPLYLRKSQAEIMLEEKNKNN